MVVDIVGADLDPMVNNRPIPMWECIEIKKGDIISFKQRKSCCRAYLLVAGGIDVPKILGSRSTYVRGRIGGLNGQCLKKGEIINIGRINQNFKDIIGRRLCPEMIPDYSYKEENEIKVILGPQDDYFTKEGIDTFLSSSYKVTIDSDRMGYRLEGPIIKHKKSANIISDGLALGSIQVPKNGKPIVMLADRHTTGGYPKIATVISVSIGKLAQMIPNDRIKFVKVSIEKAHELLLEERRMIDNMKFERREVFPVKLDLDKVRIFKIKIGEKIYHVEVEEN